MAIPPIGALPVVPAAPAPANHGPRVTGPNNVHILMPVSDAALRSTLLAPVSIAAANLGIAAPKTS